MQGPSERDIYELGETDDEAERMARRKQGLFLRTSNWSRESSLNLPKLPSLSSHEVHDQIVQCLKLSAENKINEKNAFQLHMIDFLSYSLIKQSDEVSNLQMASACLDASSKIYGCRVDKVHFDLIKVVGQTRNGEKRGHDDNDNDYTENNECQRKRRRKNYHIFSSVESLKGNLDTYNPLSLINTQNDIQTSDMLFQASLPQHANQGIALNLYKDVLLDRVPSDKYNITKAFTSLIDDFTADHLCPSYADFKFLGWLPEDELDLDQKISMSRDEDEDGEFHFDLDGPIANGSVNNNNVRDCSNTTESSNRLMQTVQNGENIVDFQDIIANNSNVNCKDSIMELNPKIDWNSPSAVKLKSNNNEGNKCAAKKRNKCVSLSYSRKLKESTCTIKYITRKKASINVLKCSEENESPSTLDSKKFNEYLLKSGETNTLSENGIMDGQFHVIRGQENLNHENGLNLSKFHDEGFDADTNGEYNHTQQLENDNDTLVISGQEAFVGDNLVTVPSIVRKIFIPYSQRAKKINMQKINKATEVILQKKEDKNENIEFSKMYAQLLEVMPKSNTESLSAGLSFVSLLHVLHKKNLKISGKNDLSDLVITNYKENK